MKNTLKKTKICSGCGRERLIWKTKGKDKYCQPCSYKIEPPKKTVKPTTKKISARSEKRIIQDKQYSTLRKRFLQEHPTCACGGVIPGCTGSDPQYLTIQHKRGRVGSLYLDTRYWCTLSYSCHVFVNENPDLAIQMGLAELRLQKSN